MARPSERIYLQPSIQGKLNEASWIAMWLRVLTENLSGTLSVRTGDRLRRIFFRKGQIVAAEPLDDQDRLGNLARKLGKANPDIMKRANRRRRFELLFGGLRRTRRFGEILVSLGALTEKELKTLLEVQVRERTLTFFALREGEFEFVEESPLFEDIPEIILEVPTRDIVYEGIKAHVPPNLLTEFYFHARHARPQHLKQDWEKIPLSLPTRDAFLLTRLEFSPTIEEVRASSAMGEEETLRTLFALFCFDLLRIPGDLRQRILGPDAVEVSARPPAAVASPRPVPKPPLPDTECFLPLISEPFSFVSNNFRLLWAQLRPIKTAQGKQILCITSSTPQEGKTFVTANLALACAENPDCRVLLIDADLRHPAIHSHLQIPSAPGLSDYLQDAMTHKTPVPGPAVRRVKRLDIVTAGSIIPNPPELLGSSVMKQLLAKVRKEYDVILIDTPPSLPIVDTKILMDLSDGVLMVVRQNFSRTSVLLEALSGLSPEQFLGFVFNDCHEIGKQYASGSYYAT